MKKFVALAMTAAMVSSAFSVNALANDAVTEEPVVAVEESAEEAEEIAEEAEAEEIAEEAEAEEIAEEVEAEEIAEEAEAEEIAEEAEAEEIAEEEAVEEIAEEEAVEEECAVAEEAKAELSNAGVAVNGKAIAPQAYTIDGYTYFKLRDVAKALAGTEAGFNVDWDQEARMTALQTGATYKAYDGGTDAAEFAKKATAHHSHDPIMVNGEEVDLTAYNIDGYNYFKLRDLGDALGFEVTWDKTARMIGINSAEVTAEETVDEETGAFEYTLETETAYAFEDETFVEEVVLICPAAEARTEYNTAFAQYEVSFTNCVFEKGLTIISDRDTNVTIDEGCVFAEGTGIVVKEATEGNHLNLTLEDPFVRVRAMVEGLNITTDNCVNVQSYNGYAVTLNGEVYTTDDFENPDGPYCTGFCVVPYYENGEAMIYAEGWGPTYEEVAAEEEIAEEEAVEEEVTEEVEETEEA